MLFSDSSLSNETAEFSSPKTGDKRNINRQYAKRQYTWFKNQMPVHWFEAQNKDEIYSAVKEWLVDEDK